MILHKYSDMDHGYMKDNVYNILKKNIMELRLKPGLSLKKDEIAKEMQVSNTPVREALVRLAEDELVDIYPQRGTYVSFISLEKIEQAEFMREHLERAVVKAACNDFPDKYLVKLQTNIKMQEIYLEEEEYLELFELDNKFHHLIFEGCNKADIWSAINQFSTHVNRMRVLSLAAKFNRNGIIAEHQKIIKAIREKNEELADEVVSKHISRINYDIDSLLSEYPDYFDSQG